MLRGFGVTNIRNDEVAVDQSLAVGKTSGGKKRKRGVSNEICLASQISQQCLLLLPKEFLRQENLAVLHMFIE